MTSITMNPPTAHAILWPVFALAAWTSAILLLIATRRLLAGPRHRIGPREYALGESARVPAEVSLPNRNYMNLLELPVLFYVVCLMAFVTQASTEWLLPLAWAYVGLRIVHSLIHVTYNRVMHRFTAFAASNGVLIAMWVVMAISLAGST